MTRRSAAAARPQRADAQRNRARILEAAETVFALEGIEVPVDLIAEKAGVGVGHALPPLPDQGEALRGRPARSALRADPRRRGAGGRRRPRRRVLRLPGARRGGGRSQARPVGRRHGRRARIRGVVRRGEGGPARRRRRAAAEGAGRRRRAARRDADGGGLARRGDLPGDRARRCDAPACDLLNIVCDGLRAGRGASTGSERSQDPLPSMRPSRPRPGRHPEWLQSRWSAERTRRFGMREYVRS